MDKKLTGKAKLRARERLARGVDHIVTDAAKPEMSLKLLRLLNSVNG